MKTEQDKKQIANCTKNRRTTMDRDKLKAMLKHFSRTIRQGGFGG